ncbi:hypothetical protein KC19_2G208000 [Ceratodon purpureus]|uniref:Uncharacterized protein n=1 Tax=Ceratodon purpureus TaxID=3225 RepID=A0A8T0J043_CERPU|nr:hypothetical protein KC19_2G208000 [Ceratodon purpureus]
MKTRSTTVSKFDADAELKLVTEIYDSRTGMWIDGGKSGESRFTYNNGKRRPFVSGVLCNGAIYFEIERVDWLNLSTWSRVLLSFNFKNDEWQKRRSTIILCSLSGTVA